MQLPFTLLATIMAFTCRGVLAAPIPQLAGEGAACNSILSSTDNGVGYGIENAEDNTAKTLARARLRIRQLAGEGAACDSILSDTDNGVGYGVKNAEDNTAKTISGAPKTPAKRQLDKIANGERAVSAALGTGATTAPVPRAADPLDGESTSAAAGAGAQRGSTEASTLEGVGSMISKRQLDKISNGAQNVANAAKVGDLTGPTTTGLDGVDGTTTEGAAQLGAEVGGTEAGTLEAVGSRVP